MGVAFRAATRLGSAVSDPFGLPALVQRRPLPRLRRQTSRPSLASNLSEVFVAQAAALATFGVIVGEKQRERRITVAGQSLCAIRMALQRKLFKKAARKRQQEQGEVAMCPLNVEPLCYRVCRRVALSL
jgi:hypothetical protein